MPAPSPSTDDLGLFLERAVLPKGWGVLYEPTVTSTNDLAREAARRGWPDRSVFVADYQTAGRGRHGRTWTAPPRTGLLMSVLLRHDGAAAHSFTMITSVAVCEAIERLLGLEPAIKWPNDVMIDERKVAGVLAEATDDGAETVVVVGVGINVDLDAESLARLPNATTLALAAGHRVHRGELLVVVLERLDAWLVPGRPALDAIWPAWSDRLWGQHQAIRVREGAEIVEGVVLGGARDGALRIATPEGVERRIVAGEILP